MTVTKTYTRRKLEYCRGGLETHYKYMMLKKRSVEIPFGKLRKAKSHLLKLKLKKLCLQLDIKNHPERFEDMKKQIKNWCSHNAPWYLPRFYR